MSIEELQKKVHENARNKGFWDDMDALETDFEDGSITGKDYVRYRNNAIGCRLALVHAEASEALEALRKGDMENFAEELADVAIRLMDVSGGLGIDLEEQIVRKMAKNVARPKMHNKLF